MWFLKPKHTIESVAKRILDGLEDGTIVLDAPDADAAPNRDKKPVDLPASAVGDADEQNCLESAHSGS